MYEVDEATVIHLDLLPAYIAKMLAGVVNTSECCLPNGILRRVAQICSMNQIH